VTHYDYDPRTFRLAVHRTTRPGFNPRFPSKRGQLSDVRVLQHLFYTYDASGNIVEIQDDAWTPAFFGNQRVEAASRYVYDSMDRLVEATGRENGSATGAPANLPAGQVTVAGFPVTSPDALRNYTERYHYDAVGNLRKLRHIAGSLGSWTRTYDHAATSNHLTGINTDNPAKAVTYGYDTHGSMANLASAPDSFDLRWNYNDMIHTIDLGGGGRAWYQYGADKQRYRKRIDRQNGTAGYWERIYLIGYELYRRYNGAQSAKVEEIESHHLTQNKERVLLVDDVLIASGRSDPRPDRVTVSEQTLFRFQYSDHLGSVRLEITEGGHILSFGEYHPFGTTAYSTGDSSGGPPPQRYRFTGKERDDESGLSLHSNRHYVPWLARWAAVDPTGVSDGPNLYSYCRCSPIRLLDDSGRQGLLSDTRSARFLTDEELKVNISWSTVAAIAQPPPTQPEVFPRWLATQPGYDPAEARLAASKRAAAAGLDPATGRRVKPSPADWHVSQSETAVASGVIGAAIGLGLILSGPPGWLGLVATLLFGTGVVAAGTGTIALGLEETRVISHEESEQIGHAALLTQKLGSPGGLAGGATGVLIDRTLEGLERGADIGNLAETALHVSIGTYSLIAPELRFSRLYSGTKFGWNSVRGAAQESLGIGDPAVRRIFNPMTARWQPQELSHWFGQSATKNFKPLFNRPWNLRVLKPWEHARVDLFRNNPAWMSYYVRSAGPVESFFGRTPLWTHEFMAAGGTGLLASESDK
jgi:RHS repeat-associated protein